MGTIRIDNEKILEYYQVINCYNFYQEGNLVNLKSSIEIIMLGITDGRMIAITSREFKEGDLLILNINIEDYPFDKLMGNITSVDKVGYMHRLDIEFMGMPNTLFSKIHKLMKEVEKDVKGVNLTVKEKELLSKVLKKLI